MINSVGNGVSNYEVFRRTITDGQYATQTTAKNFIQYYSDMTGQTSRGNALQKVEHDPSYRAPKWSEASLGVFPDIAFLEGAEIGVAKPRAIYGCVDKSSTPENPVMYMETVVDGVVKAYRVELNKIDLSDATLVEAFALSAFTCNNGKAKRSMNMYTDLIFDEYNPDYLARINIYDSIKQDYVNLNHSLNVIDKFRFTSNLDYSEKTGVSKSALDQFLEIRGIVDDIQILLDPRNRYDPNEKISARTIESALWEEGIDYVYPWGVKYSEYLNGTAVLSNSVS
ncbi:MAG: hypothetical protein LBU13_08370 [Synergistaceae bacterium]|jgi:hypothetical protein|nr:hypothetical protein [Synergistaceae bacterium]